MYSAAVARVIQAGSVSQHSFCLQLDNMMLHGTWPSPVLKICDFGELLSRVSRAWYAPSCLIHRCTAYCKQLLILPWC